ncbi:MAG TPA: hypothetical protein VG322_14745 [Candidatus Acidoferrales bacterium]|nr:hypothetical protein [Candidatus Acidoferrales bacterium]
MQFTKDTFYITLRNRLAALNPARVITLNGVIRPAVVVAVNEAVIPVKPLPNAFYLEWGAAQAVPQQVGDRGTFSLECLISYHTFGTVESGVDRGRTLNALDTELITICQPASTTKLDYTQTTPANLGTSVVWTTPQLGKVAGSEAPRTEALPRGTTGVRLERTSSLKVFFFSEVKF